MVPHGCIFHILGNVPFLIQMWFNVNSFIINGVIEQAVAFCMWAATLSGPLALVISGKLKNSTDSSLSHKSRQGTDWDPQGTCEGTVCLTVDVVGGEVVFKQIIFIYIWTCSLTIVPESGITDTIGHCLQNFQKFLWVHESAYDGITVWYVTDI